MDYVLHLLIVSCIYIILSISLNLLTGHLGQLSIAHAAFYGVGAYASALITIGLGGPFVLGVLVGMAAGGALSVLISIPSLRLHDDYFAIATFAYQMIVFCIFNNWRTVTEGPAGIAGITPTIIFSWVINSKYEFLLLGMCFVTLTFGIFWRITSSPFGRVLRAIREDEVLAESLGKNTLRFRVTSFTVSAAFAALAGCLYAHYITYIDPTSFTVMESILIISMVIVGGAGSLKGPLVGAFVLVTLPEILSLVGFPSSTAANLRQILYGLLLVVMMIVRPRGLAGLYEFGR